MRIFFILFFFININNLNARDIGETEITAEEGIEVFQNEKYYLLKKNVKIESDNFSLVGDIIKIYFGKDLYDILKIDAVGNVLLDSLTYNIMANGKKLLFTVKDEEIIIEGDNSKLITESTEMFSDGNIKVNNIDGDFYLNGANSKLISENIIIQGNSINGIFALNNGQKEIMLLDVFDEKIAYVKSNDTDMFANSIKYNKDISLIELEKNVKIMSDGETITGDYGTLDIKTNSYKIKSKNSKKVKVIISNKDE